MIGALGTLVLLLGATLLVGQAIAALASGASRERPSRVSWLAPAYGLAALLVLAGVAIRLPGHAITAAVVLAAVTIASAVYLRRRVSGLSGAVLLAAPVVAITTLAAALPFAIAGEVGILGAGLVNDDMASHLIIADYIADPGGAVPSFVSGGYPTGPHALVAAIAEPAGIDLVDAFGGLSLALAPLLGLTALGALAGVPRAGRVLGSCLVALAYLGVAYLAQGAFKEPIMSVLILGLAGSLAALLGMRWDGDDDYRDDSRRPAAESTAVAHPLLRLLPIGVLAAGVLFAYSLPGMLWVALVGGAVLAVRLIFVSPRPTLPDGWLRRAAPYAVVVVVLLAAVIAFEWERINDFTRLSALNPDRFGSQLGNLRGSLSPLEVLGIWPAGDFRSSVSAGSLPSIAFYLGAALGLTAFAAGIATGLLRRRPLAAATAIAALLAWGFLAVAGSPYVAAKGLAIAAPLVMVVALIGTLGSRSRPLVALGVVLVAAAGLSSFLVLRQAAVGPGDHADSLAQIREIVQGEDVLFLGRDDFIGWELRGSGEITGVVTNFYDVEDARPRFKKGKGGGEKFDVDVLFPRDLDEFRYVLATSGGPASDVPPAFEDVARTDDYVLYEREASTGRRTTLNEGTEIGRELDCSDPDNRAITQQDGYAVIWDPVPLVGSAERWSPNDTPADGSPVTQRIELPNPGRWLISLEYDSRRPLDVAIPEVGLETTIAANLDFRGETPTFPVAVVETDAAVTANVTVEPERPNLLGRLLHAPNEAHLRSLTATPLAENAARRVPLSEACGKYVDWYRPG